MRAATALIGVWLLTGAGAVGGSAVGAGFGKSALFAGALAGGALIAAASAWMAWRLRWVASRSAVPGACLGFVVAAPIAALNLHTPVIPVLATSLAGVGALIGARFGTRS
jgi:hypothetical protein